jgi:hypothetical protein
MRWRKLVPERSEPACQHGYRPSRFSGWRRARPVKHCASPRGAVRAIDGDRDGDGVAARKAALGVAAPLVDVALKTWAGWREEPDSDLAPATRRHARHRCVVAVHRGLLTNLALRCGDTCSAFPAEVLLGARRGVLLGLLPDLPYEAPGGRFRWTVLPWAHAKDRERPGGKLPGA